MILEITSCCTGVRSGVVDVAGLRWEGPPVGRVDEEAAVEGGM